MTYKQIYNMINAVGIPTAYHHFTEKTAQPPPFICWYFTSDDDLKADNKNYQRIDTLIIELYTDTKNYILEQTLESNLTLTFAKDEQYIESENMYMVVYTMEVLING